ncbi:MAG: sugar phosphate isomerase/epimerase [Victivallales bacterium]|nr:sugar phosphate isomerase/epimerase [Victivallales bacterium]
MFPAPFTYFLEFREITPKLRPFILAELASAGVRHLVLNKFLVAEILQDASLLKTLPNELSRAGLDLVDSHALFGLPYDLMLYGDPMQEHRILLSRLQLNIAAELGVDTMTFHIGNDALAAEIPLEKLFSNACRNLEALLPEAERCGVTLCIENSWNVISRPDSLLAFKREFPTETLGFCFDSGHANILSSHAKSAEGGGARERWGARGMEVEWEDQALEKMLPHVVNCHLHDNNGFADQHLPPGEGCVDWSRIVRLLRQAPRLKSIQSEVKLIAHGCSARKLCDRFATVFGD